MDTESRYFRIRRQDIAFFKFIIESYEGMAVVRTRDPDQAVVELMVAPGWEKAADEVIEDLREEIRIERITSSGGAAAPESASLLEGSGSCARSTSLLPEEERKQ